MGYKESGSTIKLREYIKKFAILSLLNINKRKEKQVFFYNLLLNMYVYENMCVYHVGINNSQHVARSIFPHYTKTT